MSIYIFGGKLKRGHLNMNKLTLKELAIPLINSIDSFNYLLKSHHRRTAIISYFLGKELHLNDEDMILLVISAALHDIGALSVQERDMLIKEDVENPEPHCIMGYRMLSSFEVFKDVAQTLKHHHIRFEDLGNYPPDEVLFVSQIIHLADRVDVLTLTDKFILDQKEAITSAIVEHSGTTFNPLIVEAFLKVSSHDIFWIHINNMTMRQLFEKVNFTLDYELSIDDVISFSATISKIIDYRSKFTASHSATVAQLAYFIGQQLNLDSISCKKLMVAGYLHDIGKLGIDPGIIEKNGPLTDEEYNQIKLHPYYTEQILNDLITHEWFKDIVYWAKNHHENTLGTGYPYGIEVDENERGSLIITYSDILSALMEPRPYRYPLDIEKTIEIIKNESVYKLSEKLFEVILKNKDEINKIIGECQLESKEFLIQMV